MKKSNRLFQDAERLAPPPELWKRIEARTALARGGRPEAAGFWGAPAMRSAAAAVLAVGVLGLGLIMQKRGGDDEGAAQATAGREADMVDAELLGWHADLGDNLGDNLGESVAEFAEALDVEVVEAAAEAGEML